MYFPNAFKKSFLAASATPIAASNATTALTAGQLGFFIPSSLTGANSSLTSTTTTTATTPYYLVMGSYFSSDKIGAHGGYKESVKSKLINPRFISRVIKLSAKTARQHVIKVTANAGLAQDTTYRLRVDVKGSPALRFLTHNAYKTVDYYSGCTTATPSNVKDPVMALLNWKDQINRTPFLSDLVQARAYKSAGASSTVTSAATGTPLVSLTFTWGTRPAYVAIGQRITASGATSGSLPANSFITALPTGTTATVTFPAQASAPAFVGTITAYVWDDLYSEAVTGSVYIPGTTTVSDTSVSSTYTAGNGATVYSASADAATITYTAGLEPFMEVTGAYAETAFGSCTFTPTDKYDVEPLIIYAAVVDESGNPCASTSFVSNTAAVSATNPYLSSHGIEVQSPIQAQGAGEAVLRDLILSGRYLQNAYPDSSRVDSLRMREIEADPMLGQVTRANGYDCLLVVHNVPRWNNPTSSFDNDQYLLCIWVTAGTSTTTLENFFTGTANAAQGANTIQVESF